MTVSVWQEAAPPLEAEHRDVVIGAGLVGAWTARRLVERGRDVALVERAHVASGASGRNGGFVLTAQRDPYPELIRRAGRDAAREILALVRTNVRAMARLAKEHGIPTAPGPVRLAESAADLRELEAWARALEEDGVSVDLSREDPFGAGYLGAMRIEDDFVLQPARFAEAIAASCGATLYDQNEVFAIRRDGARLIVHGRRARLRCERVWIATNGWAGAMHPFLAARVQPVRGQILVTAPGTAPLPTAGISHHGYFRPLDDGRLLIGGARAFFEAQENTSEDAVTPNLLARLVAYVERWFPMLDATPERAWSGIQGFTPDRRAIVGTVPDEPALAFAVGFSGYGNGIGLVAAERMVEHALDGADLGPLAFSRSSAAPPPGFR